VTVSGGADEWVDVTCEIVLRGNLQRTQEKHANRIYKMFQD
jgi:hypothetical protein